MNKSVILAAALAGALSSVAIADHLFWIGTDTATDQNWKSFGEKTNWCVGDSWSTATQGTRVPTVSDLIHLGNSYESYYWFDLDGKDYTIGGLYDPENDYGENFMHFRNGSVTFSGDLTNTHLELYAETGSTVVFGKTSTGRFGRQAMPAHFYVQDGGALDWFGTVSFATMHGTVYAGGSMTVDPVAIQAYGSFCDANGKGASISNHGTFKSPHGFDFSGAGASKGYFSLYQIGGTMTLGGPLTHSGANTYMRFELSGGTLNVTDDVYFRSTVAPARMEVAMTNDCAATVNVADEKSLDLSNMVFGERTTLTKTGPGTLKLGASLPTALVVSEGVVEPASGAKLGSALSFAAGTTLRFAAPGVQADAIDGVDNLTVEVTDSPGDGSYLLFSSQDTVLVAAIFAKLQAAGLTGFVNNGDSITHEKSHDSTIFAWKNEGRADTSNWRGGTYTWYPFLDPTSWQIGFDRTANTDNLVPGENDDFFISDSYQPIFAMDMGGTHRKVRNLALHLGADPSHPGDMAYYPSQAGFRQFNVRNGTLEFTGSFTNVRAQVVAKNTGRFVLSRTSAVRFGYNGAQDNLIAENGGEIDVCGLVDIHILRAEIDAGGKMVFDPSAALTVLSPGNASGSFWKNSGSLEFPHGLTFATCASSTEVRMLVEQNAGTLTFGGPIVREAGFQANIDLTIAGGTVKATGDVSFSNLRTNEVAAGSSVVFDVATGKTLDVSTMTFGEGASVTKTGAGTIRFGTSLPSALAVQGGTVEYAQPVALGESLTLGAGTTLAFASDGVSATAISGLGSATVTVDASLLTKSGALFSSPDADLTAAVFAKLEASGAEGISLNGNVILHEIAHDPSVFTLQSTATQPGNALDAFTDATVYQRFFDPATWSVGRATVGQNPQGLVPGEKDDLYINSQAPNENYRPLFAFDMDGAERLVSNYDKVDAAEKWGFNGFQIRNGTFGFSGTFQSTRSVVIAQPGGRFVLGDDATVTLGYSGAQCFGIARAGGEIVLGGNVTIIAYHSVVEAGGRLVLKPKDGALRWQPSGSAASGTAPSTFFTVNGELSIPSDLSISCPRNDNTFTITQGEGATLDLGGKIVSLQEGVCHLSLASGTINLSGKAGFTGFGTCTMAENATVTVNAPKGTSLNLSEMTFGANTTLQKIGPGRIVFGASRPTVFTRLDPAPGMLLLVR